MRRYSEAVKADVKRRMSPPQRQSVARISEELGIHVMTLYKWRKTWRLQGEVVPSSAGLIQSVSQVLWPDLPAWALLGGIASSLCPIPPLLQLILI
jgi:transposase-like protein